MLRRELVKISCFINEMSPVNRKTCTFQVQQSTLSLVSQLDRGIL
jgi:hypothetical protein